MNPFFLDPRTRLQAWKALREKICQETDSLQKIQEALNFWKQAPIEKPLIDWDNAHKWPSPWELLHSNRFCEGALTLGVAYSLLFSSPECFADLQLLLITDREQHVQKIVARTHGLILNLGWLDVNNRNKIQNCEVHSRWCFDGRNWETQFSCEKNS